MTAAGLLATLRAEGVTLLVDGGDLVVDGPEPALTDEVVDELRRMKPDIIDYLLHRAPLRLVLVRHEHRCLCGRKFACTAPSCAGKAIPCVCCRLDQLPSRREEAR
ncbi:MAG: hypothetical protein E6J71_05890 [Deltaproteobacteria bacterium]|nr:MAG: hypothetical protein E6J71_05890 [Deltaproteobacteria bacterium]